MFEMHLKMGLTRTLQMVMHEFLLALTKKFPTQLLWVEDYSCLWTKASMEEAKRNWNHAQFVSLTHGNL